MSELDIRPISAAETRPLRHRVLRPHQPPESLVYDGDDAPDTLHVGGFLPDGTLVAVASVYRESRPEDGVRRGFRLRGMAVDPSHQGRGYGARLVEACGAHARSLGGKELWCNARTSASGFYTRQGFDTEGPPFEIEGIGPHFEMRQYLG